MRGVEVRDGGWDALERERVERGDGMTHKTTRPS